MSLDITFGAMKNYKLLLAHFGLYVKNITVEGKWQILLQGTVSETGNAVKMIT